MATAIDTNIIISLWKAEEETAELVEEALNNALAKGGLVISGAVFAELLAYPKRTESFIFDFCFDTGIAIDWTMNESMWLLAGNAFQKYTLNRKKQKAGFPRRILADFLIGSHAAVNSYSLLTLDTRIYQTMFPSLSLISV